VVLLLEVENLKVNYGRIRALRGFSLQVDEGKAVAVLGSNGAGKTTLLKTISGLPQVASRSIEMKVEQGEIRFAGQKIDRELPETIVRLGIAHVPEGREIFPDLTVEENLKMGAYTRKGFTAEEIKHIYSHFPILAERRGMRAETLSGGEQQMLAIGRALLTRPRLLILDEPSLGLAPLVVNQIFTILRSILKEDPISVLLVEQNANLALQFAGFAYILENGRGVLSGTSEVLRQNETVREFYLGGGDGTERRNYGEAKTYRAKKRWR
jgi:branched-chain amino acid transport system ATP-binding protein